MQILCECATTYLVMCWMVGTIWLIQDWDEIVANNIWIDFFPRYAILAVVLHILVLPFSIPEAIWRSRHEDD